MKQKIHLCFALFMALGILGNAQGYPWENPLRFAWSQDGVTFGTNAIFQDSSGVPSLIRWKGDTLICAFQWFRQPMGSPSWDRVAVKFSYDIGQNWTSPTPIVINGIPPQYQRPFDPALTVFGGDSIRIFYSSSDGMPMGMDSTINTYSAKSHDGINYTFEPGARVDVANNRVIDPSVIQFNNLWHYLAPIGSPQQGAYHYISQDGLNFTATPDIPSDNTHNWTGNYMIDSVGEMRFYGAGGGGIWYNSSPNGGAWNGYVSTNVPGGDPSVLKVSAFEYLIVYVGPPYSSTGMDEIPASSQLGIYPNPARDFISISPERDGEEVNYRICNLQGRKLLVGSTRLGRIGLEGLPAGCYFLFLEGEGGRVAKFVKE